MGLQIIGFACWARRRPFTRWDIRPGVIDSTDLVVVLRLFDDLSEAQVAQILGCAVGTVKATMSQALARLRSDPHLVDLMERRVR
jgi:hypothetical protein